MLLLDGGDTWQGSYTAHRTKGQDMVDCMKLLKPDAMTGHWEFTYGAERVKEIVEDARLPVPRAEHARHRMAGAGVRAYTMFERGGVKIAVIGQAFPYTPVANPRWMIPNWSFGIREEDVRANVEKARARGRAAGRAAVAQRLRRRPQAGGARARAST